MCMDRLLVCPKQLMYMHRKHGCTCTEVVALMEVVWAPPASNEHSQLQLLKGQSLPIVNGKLQDYLHILFECPDELQHEYVD